MAAGGHSPSITFLAISNQYATFVFLILFTKWLPAAILDNQKPLSIAFCRHFFFFDFFHKMAAAILDGRKSLSIVFLAISDQYANWIIFLTKWLPATILDDRKSLSNAFLAISDQYKTFF